jgi:hypothetical protein
MTAAVEVEAGKRVVGRGYYAEYLGDGAWRLTLNPNVQGECAIVNERAVKHKIKTICQVKNVVVVNDYMRYAALGTCEALAGLKLEDFVLKATRIPSTINVAGSLEATEVVWIDLGREMAYSRAVGGVLFRARAKANVVHEPCTYHIPKVLFPYIKHVIRRRVDCWQTRDWTALAYRNTWFLTNNRAPEVEFPSEQDAEKFSRVFKTNALLNALVCRAEDVVILSPQLTVHSVESGAVGLCVRRLDLMLALRPHSKAQLFFNAKYLWVLYARAETAAAVPLVQRRVVC